MRGWLRSGWRSWWRIAVRWGWSLMGRGRGWWRVRGWGGRGGRVWGGAGGGAGGVGEGRFARWRGMRVVGVVVGWGGGVGGGWWWGGRVLWHSWGATETTVDATAWRAVPDAGRVLVGRPLPNTRVFVLDRWLAPVPVGAVGELY